MTYGYQQSDSFGGHKQALGFDAGASEKMRVDASIRERQRIEKERAKQLLQDVVRKHEHNKTEISNYESEARRLISEITHAMHELQDLERAIQGMEQKEHQSKIHVSDDGVKIQAAQKLVLDKKKEMEDHNRNVGHLETQIAQLQQKVNDLKKTIYDIQMTIQKTTLQIKQLESQENRNQSEAARAKSEAQFKTKDIDTKKRSIQAMDQKRVRDISEIQRLKAENIHLEMEIRQLEAKVK